MAAGANPAWVPPKPRNAAAVPSDNAVALALRLLDQSARAWRYDRDLALSRTSDAVGLIGPDAVLAILNLQGGGKLPGCGTPEWDRLVALADAGQVAIGTVLLIGDHDYVCEDRVAARIRRVSSPRPSSGPPVSLRDELRDMGMLG